MMDVRGFDAEKMERATELFLEAIGEDLTREGLRETPHRVSKMWSEFFDLRDVACKEFAEVDTVRNGMVLVKDIPLYSFCEHHLVPFFGKASVAYFPKMIDSESGSKKIIGLSKIARIVYKWSYRPQVQERLTLNILDDVREVTGTDDVIVYIDASHLCMVMRGAKASSSSTVTMDYKGCFEDVNIRREFLSLIK